MAIDASPSDVSGPKQDTATLIEVYKIAVATRQFELTQFWNRCNYFLVLNSGLFAAFFTIPEAQLRACAAIIGYIICILWFRVALGSKFWQMRWEHAVEELEAWMHHQGALGTPEMVFSERNVISVVRTHQLSNEKYAVDRFVNDLILTKPSVTQAMMLLIVAVSFVWLGLLIHQINRILLSALA